VPDVRDDWRALAAEPMEGVYYGRLTRADLRAVARRSLERLEAAERERDELQHEHEEASETHLRLWKILQKDRDCLRAAMEFLRAALEFSLSNDAAMIGERVEGDMAETFRRWLGHIDAALRGARGKET